MACEKRQNTGSCSHYICPYLDKTEHGYECVDIIDGFCEVGLGCYQKCEYSWQDGTERASQAELVFRNLLRGAY